MPTTRWWCLVMLVSAQALSKPPPTLTPQQIAERTIPSVALIRHDDSLGTGFVVRSDGVIATNLHVIAGARAATVTLAKKDYEVLEVVAFDRVHDLALVRIAAKRLTVLPLGDSDAIKPGQKVVAIGHPLGLGDTVSDGLVSGLREVEPGLKLLQISAPISPGSSGGPLVSDRGEVIGVSTLVTTRGQNLNFGMPVNDVKRLLSATQPALSLTALAERLTPTLRREVPHHDAELLTGCTAEQLQLVARAIAQAIDVGAPVYNEGNHQACFRIYESAILDVTQRLAGACSGPTGALNAGLTKAATRTEATGKAWALRDAFDGVLDVIGRAHDDPPAITRSVPHHELTLIATCRDETLRTMQKSLLDAIELGAPLFNQGNAEACFRVYQGAALDLQRSITKCPGARRALEEGVTRASAAATPEARAWAMRDAFDGLLDVLQRRVGGPAQE